MSLARLTLAFALAGTSLAASGQAANPNAWDSYEASSEYVHHWVPMPGVSGSRLGGAGNLEIKPRQGEMLIVVFLASWCEPCQRLIEDLLAIEKRYERLHARFVYVFAHDTREDAEGFMKEYGMTSGILANDAIYKAFHNPQLPTIYVGDRRAWLTTRYLDTKPEDLARLDKLLKHLTAL